MDSTTKEIRSPTTEPSEGDRFGALDVAAQHVRQLDLIDRLNRELGKTIIMVTHDPHAAAKARSIRQLDKGELAT